MNTLSAPQLTAWPVGFPEHCFKPPVCTTILASFALLVLASVKGVTANDAILSAYTPGEFPSSVYASYYWNDLTVTATDQPSNFGPSRGILS